MAGKDFDVATNIKIINWMKAELLESVGKLFKAMLKSSNEAVTDAMAAIIIYTYLIGNKTGINFSQIDLKVKKRLSTSINNSKEIDQWHDDLMELLKYINNKMR